MKVVFSDHAWEDYLSWQETDAAAVQRINALIRAIQAAPFEGAGKPERLKNALEGYWSRRINAEDRLVYKVHSDVVFIALLRYLY